MDRKGYVHKRGRKYMAQILGAFEDLIEPLLPQDPDTEEKKQKFKALTRARTKALATDACDVLGNEDLNGAGQDLRDRLHPEGRP